MVLVSIISAVDYFQAFWKKIDHSSSDRRRASVVLQRGKKNAAPVN
jgi:CDP-diacylglycerol--glycerol-3-phosphate 3-phosphatidyltransferase